MECCTSDRVAAKVRIGLAFLRLESPALQTQYCEATLVLRETHTFYIRGIFS